MIGVISDHAARYTWFTQSLAGLHKPDLTVIEWRVGSNRGVCRDMLARACLDQGCDWLFFIDDDQVFQPGALTRLLAHDEPVVSALIIQRGAPFLPTVFVSKNEEGRYFHLDLQSVGHDELVVCAGIGTGGLLIRADVLRQLDDGCPWFVYSEESGEDLYFSNRCEEAGIQLLVDTGCLMGHLIPAAVIPAWLGDRWGVGIQLADGTSTAIEMNHERRTP